MRYLTSILFALLAICSWSSFNTVQNQTNPLYGKIFREINEFRDWPAIPMHQVQ